MIIINDCKNCGTTEWISCTMCSKLESSGSIITGYTLKCTECLQINSGVYEEFNDAVASWNAENPKTYYPHEISVSIDCFEEEDKAIYNKLALNMKKDLLSFTGNELDLVGLKQRLEDRIYEKWRDIDDALTSIDGDLRYYIEEIEREGLDLGEDVESKFEDIIDNISSKINSKIDDLSSRIDDMMRDSEFLNDILEDIKEFTYSEDADTPEDIPPVCSICGSGAIIEQDGSQVYAKCPEGHKWTRSYDKLEDAWEEWIKINED